MDILPLEIRDSLSGLISHDESLENIQFLLAVSGGLDSMTMAECFRTLGLHFGVAHFNFMLRGTDSDLDEAVVRDYCQKHQIKFHVKTDNTINKAKELGLSIQETAREQRYRFFDHIIKIHDYDYLCTGHHGNDQLETFFMHLIRGSGLKGLTGIPEKRNNILRPMLWIPHAKILNYQKINKVPYRMDQSNISDKYLRNRIRHKILAPLEKLNPNYISKSLDSLLFLADYQNYISIQLNLFQEKNVTSYTQDIHNICLDRIASESPDFYLIKWYLLSRKMYPDSVQKFIESWGQWITGSVYKGDKVNGWYDRRQLWLITNKFYEDWNKEDIIEILPGSAVHLPGGDYVEFITDKAGPFYSDSNFIPVIIKNINYPLRLRHRKPGDHVEQGSSAGFRKSLKKIFNENRIPRPFKDRLYILTDANDKIIAVPGLVVNRWFTNEKDADSGIKFRSSLNFLFDKKAL